jgi:hypothetical protein
LKIRHYLHLILTLPPGGIWRRVKKRAWQFAQRIQVRITNASFEKLNFRLSLVSDIPDESALIKRIKQGPYAVFFIDDQKKEWITRQFRNLCPGEEENVMRAANLVCQHVFDLLGSGPCALGQEIDWQLDFKSGHRWNEKAFYQDLHPAPYPGGYDIKVPWELSRCQHFAWLGQAYWLSADETYAREFCSQVERWISNNPPQLGVNWVCAMDVGIRAVNWLWGYAYFRHSPSLSDEFHLRFYHSLLEHGRHIMHNLEYSEALTSNHYLSDLVGLIYLGVLLPELKEAQTWQDFGLRELESEMFKQVYPDGVDFEASTNYHRLTTELFLSATILAKINGKVFSPEYLARLERMVAVLGLIMRPDGTTPVIGDQDNGRLHRLKVWGNPILEWSDFRPLFAAGAIWFQKPVNIQFTNTDLAEAFWLTGPESVRQYQQNQQKTMPLPPASALLPDGGWAVLRDHDNYLMIKVGSVGQNGQGGHSHNDSLNIEVFAGSQTWIVDPGTFVYTADYETRHTFRQTQAHNTVSITRYEQSLIDVKSPFRVEAPSKTKIIHWETCDNFSLIAAEVLYAGNSPAIAHRRAVLYSPEAYAWLIADRVFPTGLDARMHLTFSIGVKAEELETPFGGIQLRNDNGISFWVCSLQGEKPTIAPTWVSNSYGVKQESLQAGFRFTENPIHYWALLSEKPNRKLEERIQSLQNTWERIQGGYILASIKAQV